MTPLQELFLVLAALYVLECCHWVPDGALLVIAGRRTHWRRPAGSFGKKRSGLILGPLAPWTAAYVVEPWTAPQKARELARRTSFAEARQAAARARDAGSNLRVATTLTVVLLAALAPAQIALRGLSSSWRGILAAYGIALLFVLVSWVRAHRTLFPDRQAERWQQALTMTLLPAAAARAYPSLTRDVLADFHPLAAVAALDDRRGLERLARPTLLALRHPVLEEREGSGGEARDVLRHKLEGELRRAGVDLDELLAPPHRDDPTSGSYCPRCRELYRLRDGLCASCPGIELVAFPH